MPDIVLITRPQPRAMDTAQRVAALGFRPIIAPMLEIRRLDPALPQDAGAVLLTSGNAVPSLPEWARKRPIFAVGDATAALARRAGFPDVASADGDSAALAAMTRAHLPKGTPLLLLSGKDQGHELAALLSQAGWPVTRREVYDALPAATLPPEASAALREGTVHAVLFFSARTAACFATLLLSERLAGCLGGTDACAIAAPAAVALEPLAWRQIRIAARPTQEALLALLQ